MRYNLGRHVRFDLSHEFRRLEIPDGRLFVANLSQIKIAYQVTVRMFFRAILQYQDVKENLALYPLQCPGGLPGGPDCPFAPRSKNLFIQLLFSYKINPQTAFFLGYSDSKDAFQEIVPFGGPPGGPPAGFRDAPLTPTSRIFFLKLGYAWVI
jgi:hypothetical protein